MIEALKKSTIGKVAYRLSKRPVSGWPLRKLAWFVQLEMFQPSHINQVNRAHNRQQETTLTTFENKVRS